MDKQIEEMEKDIAFRMAMAKGVAGSMNNGVEGWLTSYLHDLGYRKIPENAVVLTREEYEKHKGFSREEVDEISETAINNSRKKTVEKFTDWLKTECYEGGIDSKLVIVSFSRLDEIAKEIMEGKV